ncbi:Oidioi.mRNA.OKI2018_I69.PAR.g9472.t1.cds [Oikopleura dioica]|uniref:Oidioi.mRNA.OKI2018_I69.PAR.g9472.t1.cds n=1 Tax=Oikopleura dioica TaxID=34765 RepID=A0ABN7RQ86_OIKDI|nr:Oidioi.mRNA.OKI2018_I69.PAR.g9472.t1.cds [Oikopleura dioica]
MGLDYKLNDRQMYGMHSISDERVSLLPVTRSSASTRRLSLTDGLNKRLEEFRDVSKRRRIKTMLVFGWTRILALLI